ncbi:MAG: glycosyltransferase family 39 protein [Candidatus Aminicenantes bacterium]|nr:glycosyltransferase family 39 protein [Candidatus Aminicenantes bacterium]
MKAASEKHIRIAAVLSAVIGSLVIFMATMTGYDKFREKLIQQPVRPVAGSLQLSATYPHEIQDSVLLLEIKIESAKKQGLTVVSWNGSELDRIHAHGHHFIKIPRQLFLKEGNRLSLQGLDADSSVTVLEIKNLYGFSTGLLNSVMVVPGSSSLQRLPWPLAMLLVSLLLFVSLVAPKSTSWASENRWLRRVASTIIAFFIGLLVLPLVIPCRVFMGPNTTAILFIVLYWPGLWLLLRAAAGFFKSRLWPWIKLKWLRPDCSPLKWKLMGTLALALLFVFFAVHRQRYVGASDWYGYYAESLLFQQGQLTIKPTLTQSQHLVAFTPLGFYAVGNRMIPQYPPGFPLLLALFGLVGLEFFVNALCGVLTVLFLYLILKDIISQGAALLYTVLWAFFPMTLWGSMYLMSDLVATLFILMTYYFFRRNKIFWSGVVFSFAVTIRPSCVLFFIIFLPLLLKNKKFWPFCFSSTIIGSLYGLYNWTVFGKPWITGYGKFAKDLMSSVFWHHFLYYGKTMLVIMTPLLIIPALWTLVRRIPQKWFYFSWLAGFWIFYSFWKSGGDVWWYLRFILPGLPALFIISAIGMHDIHLSILAKKPGWRRMLNISAVLILLVMLSYFYKYAEGNDVLTGDKGEMFFRACTEIQSILPANALVGGLEMSGPIKLYTRLESYRWDLEESLDLIRDFLKKGRPLYLLVEPWHREHPDIQDIDRNFVMKKISDLPGTYGMQLFQISLHQE